MDDRLSTVSSAAAAGSGGKPAALSTALIASLVAVFIALVVIGIALYLFFAARRAKTDESQVSEMDYEPGIPEEPAYYFATQEPITEATPMTVGADGLWMSDTYVEEGSAISFV
jgi:hypothetical protein